MARICVRSRRKRGEHDQQLRQCAESSHYGAWRDIPRRSAPPPFKGDSRDQLAQSNRLASAHEKEPLPRGTQETSWLRVAVLGARTAKSPFEGGSRGMFLAVYPRHIPSQYAVEFYVTPADALRTGRRCSSDIAARFALVWFSSGLWEPSVLKRGAVSGVRGFATALSKQACLRLYQDLTAGAGGVVRKPRHNGVGVRRVLCGHTMTRGIARLPPKEGQSTQASLLGERGSKLPHSTSRLGHLTGHRERGNS
jgi:hypothetical protein